MSHCPKNAEAITPIKYSVVFFPPGKISGRPYFTNVTTADLCPWGKIYAIWYRMKTHYCDVIISVVASQITCVSSVCSTVCSGGNKEIIKAPRHWPLCGEFTRYPWIPLTKGQSHGKCFHLIMSTWSLLAFISFSYNQWGMLPWWPLLWLLPWRAFCKSSLCN